MNILVLNGSPKGKNSITLQTALYLQKKYSGNTFDILHIGQRIKQFENDFTEAKNAFEKAELIIFTYPVYTFLAPYQLQRFIELIKENGIDLRDKFATQITTSKHFYDVTAHKYIEENCYDLGLKYLRGFSADMEDLLSAKGQNEAISFFEQLMFDIDRGIFHIKISENPKGKQFKYQPQLGQTVKTTEHDVVVVTNCLDNDADLQNMITDFCGALPYKARIINLRKFNFSGGCLGCMSCAVTGKCIYKDGFDDFLREKIQNADAIVYAFTIENHYTHSSFKCYDDRQFCNGHRTITEGMPLGYIISGAYSEEPNLQTLIEARSEVGGMYLTHIATDENDTTREISKLVSSLCYALKNKPTRPKNFYGVGGTKIFRDLIYLMQGMMKADHKFYKKHGIYDFPQNKPFKILQMKLIGTLLVMPTVQKKMKGKMSEYIIAPYKKVIDEYDRKK